MEPNPPSLLNFPEKSNPKLLRELVCYLSKLVQEGLEVNVTKIDIEAIATPRQRGFNWTVFNEKIIEIYQYIDAMVHQEDERTDWKRMEKLKRNFETSWTKDVTVKDAWEIR